MGEDQGERRRRQERARRHPTRSAILATLGDDRRLPPTMICQELADSPSLSTVAYHLAVLLEADLVRTGGEPTAPVYYID
jgi:DNA-binding transcriptional ArsR family regulator